MEHRACGWCLPRFQIIYIESPSYWWGDFRSRRIGSPTCLRISLICLNYSDDPERKVFDVPVVLSFSGASNKAPLGFSKLIWLDTNRLCFAGRRKL